MTPWGAPCTLPLAPCTLRVNVPVAIALGSNLGDRQAHLDFAVRRLGAILSAVKVSSYHETEPVGVGDQPRFLNAAVVGQTTLTANELLDALLAIERERGRDRPFVGAPRTLDLDLILYGNRQISESGLIVPHPRFRARRFVLEPLSEIASDIIDPVSGRTIAELAKALQT